MKIRNKKILSVVAIVSLLVTFFSLSYAFFKPQGADGVIKNVTIQAHTVDSLSFSISNAISIEATQDNFIRNGVNQSGESTSTAVLSPNSKTGSASKNYYLYLNLSENEINYSSANTNHDPELLLQVFDGNNSLVALTGVGTQKTVGGLTGYDITGKEGLVALLDNHTITASNNNTTTENYRVVITLINHNFNQNDHAGKSVTARLFIQTDATVNPVEVTYSNPDYTTCTDINCALNELFGEL